MCVSMERKLALLAGLVVCAMVVMLPKAEAKRWMVGGRNGWTNNVNYTVWAKDIHFYKDDWLFFVYDRNQQSVLEVNKTDYEKCNSDHPLHNYTTGAGRDVVHLNVTRHYYFISGNGFCYGGMKLAVHVVNLPPPPQAAPVKNGAEKFDLRGQFVLPAMFAIGAVWDAFVGIF